MAQLRTIVKFLAFVILVQSACSQSKANDNEKSVSTSIAGMEMLLETERQLILTMERYANLLDKKLTVIRSAIAEMRAENDKSQTNSEEYLSNPLNSFALIRRMHEDWISWELYLRNSVGEAEINLIEKLRADNMPNSNEFNEATDAIYRLHTTYDLNPADMAAGVLGGKKYDARFSALDCFSIGNQLLAKNHIYHSAFWLFTALGLYKDSDINAVHQFDKVKIFELYAQTLLKQNRLADGKIVIGNALDLSPNNARLLLTRAQIEHQINTATGTQHVMQPPSKIPSTYESCCRGECSKQPSRLHCVYNTTTTAFLKLAPLKLEIIRLDPYIVMYHDVISDAEIATLKDMAWHTLKRATVYDEGDKKSLVVNRRTSKFSWFGDNTNVVTKRLNKRIADMTGFDLIGSEMLQVMNYGLGGHYDNHYDFFNLSSTADVVKMQGDRIATVLFYLSDVVQGGATVFPNIQTAVYPRKGSAVMWYNLNNRGEGDWQTLHAACPVIVGSKWVTNKWIRERSQVFRRPCYK